MLKREENDSSGLVKRCGVNSGIRGTGRIPFLALIPVFAWKFSNFRLSCVLQDLGAKAVSGHGFNHKADLRT